MVKGSHGLSLLKGPKTEEDVVQSIWGKQEKSVTVIHYTAGGSMVNHTIRVTPLMAEDSNTVTHYLMISSFEKYIGRGSFFHKAKAVIKTNKFGGSDKEELAPGLETPASAQPQQRVKNLHHLKKENALKKLELYADTMRQSVMTKVPLTQILRTQSMPKAGVITTESKEQEATADCINSSPPPHTPVLAIYLLRLLLRCSAVASTASRASNSENHYTHTHFLDGRHGLQPRNGKPSARKAKAQQALLGQAATGTIVVQAIVLQVIVLQAIVVQAIVVQLPLPPCAQPRVRCPLILLRTHSTVFQKLLTVSQKKVMEAETGRIACIKTPLTNTPLTHHPQSEVAILVSTLRGQVQSTSDSEVVNIDSGGGGVWQTA